MHHYETVATGETSHALDTLQAALRARRAARAAYGANALRIDYTTPQAEREATYRRLYAAVQAAEATLAEALDALEALL